MLATCRSCPLCVLSEFVFVDAFVVWIPTIHKSTKARKSEERAKKELVTDARFRQSRNIRVWLASTYALVQLSLAICFFSYKWQKESKRNAKNGRAECRRWCASSSTKGISGFLCFSFWEWLDSATVHHDPMDLQLANRTYPTASITAATNTPLYANWWSGNQIWVDKSLVFLRNR